MSTNLFQAAGNLYWYLHEGWPDGSVKWKGGLDNPVRIGEGYEYQSAFAADDGVIYAVGFDGNLYWYQDKGWQDRTQSCSERKIVGLGGWQEYLSVFAGAEGVIYAVSTDGKLYWYQHKGWREGTQDWTERQIVGLGGWQNYVSVFAADEGVIYAVGADGKLYWYQHKGWREGTQDWSETKIVGLGGWQDYVSVFAADEGVIYAIASDGKLYWYRHEGWREGTQDWSERKVVGDGGWLTFKSVFATNDGVIYGVGRDSQSWMSSVYDRIKWTSLSLLALPGSHDSGAYPDIEKRSQAQEENILGQLYAGVRFFDFRVRVNNGVYYAVHGPDNTEHDYTAVSKVAGKSYLLDDIAHFLKAYKRELVTLKFSHFDAHEGQRFNPTDAKNLVKLIGEHFGNLLVYRDRPTVTYGECVNTGRQVVAIIDDDDNWYEHPSDTTEGKAERANSFFWSSPQCLKERYSDYYVDINVADPIGDLGAKIQNTLEDQENYLLAPTGGENDHRSRTKFWVSQAVLNYAAVTHDGKSQNYYGAQAMNQKFADTYEHYWARGLPSLPANAQRTLRVPNILLFDFACMFDDFVEGCIRIAVTKKLVAP